ncbi:MAG: flagellar hook capping FlgD N-terminal domain-containing protein [Opitutaceae bacterium]
MSDVSSVSRLPTASDPELASELSQLDGFDTTHDATLDQSDFLSLLCTQLQNQDPTDPQDTGQWVTQMATYTSVQQMSELVTSLKSFIVAQDFASAQSMLGKYVTVTQDDETVSGLVDSVGYDDKGVSVITINGENYSPAYVTSVRNEAPATTETSDTSS